MSDTGCAKTITFATLTKTYLIKHDGRRDPRMQQKSNRRTQSMSNGTSIPVFNLTSSNINKSILRSLSSVQCFRKTILFPNLCGLTWLAIDKTLQSNSLTQDGQSKIRIRAQILCRFNTTRAAFNRYRLSLISVEQTFRRVKLHTYLVMLWRY